MIEYTIPKELVSRAFYSKWHEGNRRSMYSRTDGDNVSSTDRKVLIGNLGEVAAYGAYCGILGIPCQFPNLLKKNNPGVEIWPDDLIFMDKWKIGRRNLTQNHSVKGQFFSDSQKYTPSWVFQISGNGYNGERRRGDPLATDPNLACLFIGVIVDDSKFNQIPNIDLQCKIYTFFWPQISSFLASPKLSKFAGHKKALYLNDIKNLEIDPFAMKRYD